MNRASLARLALRSYPAAAPRPGEAEMVSALLDAGDASRKAFIRELVSVSFGGLVQRMVLAQHIGPFRIAANALVYGGLTLCVWMAANASYVAAPSTGAHLWTAGFCATVVLYGLGFRRAAGVIGIAALVSLRFAGGFSSTDYMWAGCQLVSFCAMLLMPPTHRDWRLRLSGMALAVAALAGALLFGALPMGWYLMGLVGVVVLPLNPGLTLGIGAMLLATTAALGMPSSALSTGLLLLLFAAPAALAIVIAARRTPHAARRTPHAARRAAVRTGRPVS